MRTCAPAFYQIKIDMCKALQIYFFITDNCSQNVEMLDRQERIKVHFYHVYGLIYDIKLQVLSVELLKIKINGNIVFDFSNTEENWLNTKSIVPVKLNILYGTFLMPS